MPRERFLLYMLAGIFLFQASTFGVGLYYCAQAGPEEVQKICPELGDRYEATFAVMIATTLALLTGKPNVNS